LLDMGIESFLVSSALSGVLSQRLVRRLCKTCRGSGVDSVEGKKCKTCAGRGFRGRIGIFELMVVNDELREAINARRDSNVLAQIAMRHGLRPLAEDGRDKVAAGITTEAEVAGVAFDLVKD
jgi:type II secretory ATPase GspE/PulE/Tfp pilus assembly ATPase PilB-like protein